MTSHPLLDALFKLPLDSVYIFRRCYWAALVDADGLVPLAIADRERRSFPRQFRRLLASGLIVERADGRVELAPLPTDPTPTAYLPDPSQKGGLHVHA